MTYFHRLLINQIISKVKKYFWILYWIWLNDHPIYIDFNISYEEENKTLLKQNSKIFVMIIYLDPLLQVVPKVISQDLTKLFIQTNKKLLKKVNFR